MSLLDLVAFHSYDLDVIVVDACDNPWVPEASKAAKTSSSERGSSSCAPGRGLPRTSRSCNPSAAHDRARTRIATMRSAGTPDRVCGPGPSDHALRFPTLQVIVIERPPARLATSLPSTMLNPSRS